MELPKRKPNRLKNYDYDREGAYFITICTQDRRCLLSHIVGDAALGVPKSELTDLGRIVEKYILSGNQMDRITVEKYVVMPNHIHLLLLVDMENGGTPRAASPTKAIIPRFVAALKRLVNKLAEYYLLSRHRQDLKRSEKCL